MLVQLKSLWRNLLAGLRLACFLPVTRLAFRIDIAQLVLLFIVSALIDVGGDWFRVGPQGEFSALGAGTELCAGALLLLAAALLALCFRQRDLALAIPVIVLAAIPVAQALHFLPYVLQAESLPFAWALQIADSVLTLWTVLILIRGVAVAFAPPPAHYWLPAIGGGLLLAAPIWLSSHIAPNDPWWREASTPKEVPAGMSAGSEAVLATQNVLLDNVLADLQDERPGVTDLYFVGFAPYGKQDVFRKDVEAAQEVMDGHWGTQGRSVVLLNSPDTLLTAPFATITNLRETLNEVGAAIDPEDDVVMVYLASHGSRDNHLLADLPPLQLVELSPPGLKQLLDDAGIKWRIVVVSACYSGGFVDPLKDEHTLIITASQAGRTSFGCGEDSAATFFGEAFFQKGMATTDSLSAAFDIAKAEVAAREKSGGFTPPSDPQWWAGEAIADKLKTLRKGGTTGGVITRFRAPRGADRHRPPMLQARLTRSVAAATIRPRCTLHACP
jgi:hypothetical protein